VSREILLIQGGGVGLDEEAAVRRVLAAAGVDARWRVFEAGQAAIEKGLPPLPPAMLEAVRTAGRALKTKLLNPPGSHDTNYNVQLRRALELFASVRPLRNLEGVRARFRNVDILLVREITEDLYAAGEHEIVAGVVQSIKVVTEAACRRVCRFAFALARVEGRRTIHCVHKANILKLADGLFLECFRETARGFPEIQPREMIVDNCCMQLVSKPSQFEVLVTGNLYGDLLSDLGAGLVGGISATVGINHGVWHGNPLRVYESIHGASREVVGENRANPLALTFAACALLRDEGETAAAERIRTAVRRVLEAGQVRTRDLGGTATTLEMAGAIEAALREAG
jgi:isocitrate dehydrogenase (NAD+)